RLLRACPDAAQLSSLIHRPVAGVTSARPFMPATGRTPRNGPMRASKLCSVPDCPNPQPCPEHERKPWDGRTGRHGRMRSGSAEQRLNRLVMLRYEGRCHVCGGYGADEVDHVVPLSEGGSDGAEN